MRDLAQIEAETVARQSVQRVHFQLISLVRPHGAERAFL